MRTPHRGGSEAGPNEGVSECLRQLHALSDVLTQENERGARSR